jgi:hypothetical protein
MSDLKNDLQQLFDKLKGVETRARGLKNQNLADIAASAHGRVKQMLDHPDLELVDERKDPGDSKAPKTKEEAIASYAKAGDANPEASAKMRWPTLFGAGPFKSAPDDPNAPPSYPELARESQAARPPQPSGPLGADEYARNH